MVDGVCGSTEYRPPLARSFAKYSSALAKSFLVLSVGPARKEPSPS